MMNIPDHLSLRLVRLQSAQQLQQTEAGLNFLLSKGGIGRFTSMQASHRLVAGDILVSAGVSRAKLAVFDRCGEFHFWTFSVILENLLPLFDTNEIGLLRHVFDHFQAGRLYPGQSPLAAECRRLLGAVPTECNLDHRGQLVRIAASILSVEFKDALALRNGAFQPDDHMVQVFDKLTSSELIHLSVGEMADRFSCSRRQLNRLFHRHFGVSVAALRMEMRLIKAVSLLRDIHTKIITVAEECGFNHLGLFNTCFRRRFGASPGQWRKTTCAAARARSTPPAATPSCPMRQAGLCPLQTGPAQDPPAVLTTCLGKILNGADVLEDIKRHDRILGALRPTPMKSNLPGAR